MPQATDQPGHETGCLVPFLGNRSAAATLPVWLSETQTVSLDLESSCEETCRVLRIP